MAALQQRAQCLIGRRQQAYCGPGRLAVPAEPAIFGGNQKQPQQINAAIREFLLQVFPACFNNRIQRRESPVSVNMDGTPGKPFPGRIFQDRMFSGGFEQGLFFLIGIKGGMAYIRICQQPDQGRDYVPLQHGEKEVQSSWHIMLFPDQKSPITAFFSSTWRV